MTTAPVQSFECEDTSLDGWFDFRAPDYDRVIRMRIARLKWIRRNQGALKALKEFYKDHLPEFVEDWMSTFDPRNAGTDLPTSMPFVLMPRQWEYLEWLHERWKKREPGLVEKSRDMGITWLCCAFAVWGWIFHQGFTAGFGSRKEDLVDRAGDPDSIFWKIRFLIESLPAEFIPTGFDAGNRELNQHMLVKNPANGATLKGEAGKNIGRGGRTSIYFKDEAAHYEQAESIDAALSQTTKCPIDVSTPNGEGNPFWQKRFGGRIPVFVFDWREDLRKDAAWYEEQKRQMTKVALAQEVDRDYGASVHNQLIRGDLVDAAIQRQVQAIGKLMVGVDPARYGDDRSVISFRRGRVLLRQVVLSKVDGIALAARTRTEIKKFGLQPAQIAVDANGVGASAADTLRAWYGEDVVVDVLAQETAWENGEHYNLRSFMWHEMAEWLEGAALPGGDEGQELRADLVSVRYKYKGGLILLLSKDEMRALQLRSPDCGDSLALTFAKPPKKDTKPDRSSVVHHSVLDEAVGW